MMTSAVVPRPIAFVSTKSAEGKINLAPFSYFQVLTHDPPLIMISPTTLRSPEEHDKDTAENIKLTKEFTVNIVSDAFVEAMNWSSIDMPLSEWHGSGLTPIPSVCAKLKTMHNIDERKTS
jgi:flavin reductase (DIM6/NTAB) family NADH-FMN oxidoreductase RutF